MQVLPTLALAGASYLIGGLSAGYWLVRWRTGGDVREQGSGATGATNAGRVLGRGGFALTLALDAAKGAGVVLAARGPWFPEPAAALAALAVVLGHVWPLQLRFRGGKGVAPLLGAWLVLAPLALAPCALVAATALALTRRFVVSGMCGLLLLPIGTHVVVRAPAATVAATLALLVVLWAHRDLWRRATPVQTELEEGRR